MADKAVDFEEALRTVINELKAPKNQYNGFGKYKYRNAEDILEAAKPLLFANKLRLKTSEKVVQVGDRYYVESTVTVKGYGESDSATGYARESESKKGMDDAQVTGSTSSYAKKYALNDMFDIDDTKDADSQDNRKESLQTVKPVTVALATPEQKVKIGAFLALEGIPQDGIVDAIKKEYGIEAKSMTIEQADNIIKDLQKEKS